MAAKQPTSFTVRESEILTVAFQCIKERPNIDFELMANKASFQSAKSARDTFNKLYNKILSGQQSSSANGDGKEQSGELSPKKKKATPSKPNGGEGEDDDEDASPTKKKKATPGKAKGKKKPVADAKDENGTITVKSEVVEQAGDDD